MRNRKEQDKKTSIAADDNRYITVQIDNSSLSPMMVESLHSLLKTTEPIELLRALQTAFISVSLANDPIDREQLDLLAILLIFVADIEEERFRILQKPTVN